MYHSNPFVVLQVNLKMREITEKEHKSKQHLLESPSHQKVPDIPEQVFNSQIVKFSNSQALFRPGFNSCLEESIHKRTSLQTSVNGVVCLENIIQTALEDNFSFLFVNEHPLMNCSEQ